MMKAIDLNLRPALSGHVRLKTDPVTGEPVLLFPEGLLELNATAGEIAARCDGRATGNDIVAALAAGYDAAEADLRADVAECLADLLRRNLIVLVP